MDSSMSKLFLIQDTTQRNLKLQPPEWKVQPNKESQLGFLQEKKSDFTRNLVYCKLKHEIYPAKKKQQFMKI